MRRILLCFAVLTITAFAQQAAPTHRDPHSVDYEKVYQRPTITAMAPVNSRPGYPSRMHIHIQFRSMQYVCMPTSEKKFQRANLKVGMLLELRESGRDLYVRHDRAPWLRLRLLQKEELHNL